MHYFKTCSNVLYKLLCSRFLLLCVCVLLPYEYFCFIALVIGSRHHDSGGNHKCEGGGDHQGDLGLSPLQEVTHQHAGSGEGEWRHQRALLRRHALPQVEELNIYTKPSGYMNSKKAAYYEAETTGNCSSHNV